ncbi:mannose-6-phosphate isomerase [Cryptococcus sp. DSM 104549]
MNSSGPDPKKPRAASTADVSRAEQARDVAVLAAQEVAVKKEEVDGKGKEVEKAMKKVQGDRKAVERIAKEFKEETDGRAMDDALQVAETRKLAPHPELAPSMEQFNAQLGAMNDRIDQLVTDRDGLSYKLAQAYHRQTEQHLLIDALKEEVKILRASTPPTMAVFKMEPGIQLYDRGKKGSASLAAHLAVTSIPNFSIDVDNTYAELWMGTHPTLPSKLSDSTLLSAHLKAHPELIGASVSAEFEDCKDGFLPFLFKVLSIGSEPSIQAHPDKPLARKLFDERPEVYKDPNHKPEMAIALTPFLAFLNFLPPPPTLLLHLLTVPELSPLIPSQHVQALATSLTLPTTLPPNPFLFRPLASAPTAAQKDILKDIFGALMNAEKPAVEQAIAQLVERYEKKESIAESEKELVDLALMLEGQYPGDVGVLCVFMLNVVELKKGEAAFLGANEPHAYIEGDIIECMATSDNVVRAGLTPKLRDLLRPAPFSPEDTATQLYDPPIAEFSVLRVELAEGGKAAHRAVDGPSVCIVTRGKGVVRMVGAEGTEFERGDVLFVGAGKEVEWEAKEGLEVFRAFVEA